MFWKGAWSVKEITLYEEKRIRDPFLDDLYHKHKLDIVTRPWERVRFLVSDLMRLPPKGIELALFDFQYSGCTKALTTIEEAAVCFLKHEMIGDYFERVKRS